MIYNLFRQFAFQFDPEAIHHRTLSFLNKYPYATKLFQQNSLDQKFETRLSGFSWPFPVGLAAGLDKNAEAFEALSYLHFGALEMGTITLRPQAGNPKPRLFRYPEKQGLRNALGFNNLGAQEILQNIQKMKKNKVLGINLGKNKDSEGERAQRDYIELFKLFEGHGDYLVFNVSSPNTPGLRQLQSTAFFQEVLNEINPEKKKIPLFIKTAPELEQQDLEKLAGLFFDYGGSGIISCNTLIDSKVGPGGLSGGFLKQEGQKARERALNVAQNFSDFNVIGCGGISSFDDLWKFWKKGGRAVQVYTSFIYQGPGLLKRIKKETEEVLEKNQFKDLEELFQNISHLP